MVERDMTSITSSSFHKLSDGDLLTEVARAAANERHATALLLAALTEFDARRLYLGEGFSSLFTYCTQALHLSEHAAYNRIEAARAARRFPVILELIDESAITLTTVRLLAPHLTIANHGELLESRQTCEKLRRAQDLLRHTVPDGDPAIIVDRALTMLIAELERAKSAGTHRPRPDRASDCNTRHIPAHVNASNANTGAVFQEAHAWEKGASMSL
jgi:hypothetical protein